MLARRLLVGALVVLLLGPAATALVREVSAPAESLAAWEVTSGDWSVDGATAETSSETFRARTVDDDLDDVVVDLRFRIDGYAGHEGAAEHDWDGVHVGIRYATPDDLYYVSLARRDGTVAVKRKADGEYETLQTGAVDVRPGEWHTAHVTTSTTADGAVEIDVAIDGEPVLSIDDPGAAALTEPGRVSLRSDAVDVTFDDVVISDG